VKAVSTLVDLLAPAHEHEFEAVHGLPEPLPAGETQLWQGSPDPLLLARQALHLDLLLVYFGGLLAWRAVSSAYDGASLGATLLAMAGMLAMTVLGLGLVGGIAWLMARTTVYTITNRRVVMRVGVVLSITFNLPFAQIASAGFKPRGKRGSPGGDIVLSLAGSDRIAYLHLWPRVRPWQLKRTQPMLRGLADARSVAQTLASALLQAEAARVAQESALPVRAFGQVDAQSGVPRLVSNPASPATRQPQPA